MLGKTELHSEAQSVAVAVNWNRKLKWVENGTTLKRFECFGRPDRVMAAIEQREVNSECQRLRLH